MSITSALVLYTVIWFIVFFVMIPLRLTTQGEAGDVIAGTHASAPENHNLKRKAIITTVIAAVLWGAVTWVIFSGLITIEMLDFFGYGADYKRGL